MMPTHYFVQSYHLRNGQLGADLPIRCHAEITAVSTAKRIERVRAGVLAIARNYDEASKEYGPARVLYRSGKVPVGTSRLDG